MVQQPSTPNEDNESTFGGDALSDTSTGPGSNQSGTFMSSWKRADVAVAHVAAAAYELHDLAREPDQTCRVHTTGASYTVDLSFPTGYPDQQPLTDYLIPTRDDFVEFAQSPPEHDWPYSLGAKSTTYQSGTQDSGTQSVVLEMSQDTNPHPGG